MQSQIVFYVDMQGKGKGPLPLHSIPKTQHQQQNQEQQQNQNEEQNQGRLHRRLDTPRGSKIRFCAVNRLIPTPETQKDGLSFIRFR